MKLASTELLDTQSNSDVPHPGVGPVIGRYLFPIAVQTDERLLGEVPSRLPVTDDHEHRAQDRLKFPAEEPLERVLGLGSFSCRLYPVHSWLHPPEGKDVYLEFDKSGSSHLKTPGASGYTYPTDSTPIGSVLPLERLPIPGGPLSGTDTSPDGGKEVGQW